MHPKPQIVVHPYLPIMVHCCLPTTTYRLYNKDSINAIQAGSNTTKNNLLNTQAVFGYFEKSINNVDSVNISSPLNATIKNVNISFDSPSSTSSANSIVSNSVASTSTGCSMSFTVTIEYSLEIWTDGNNAWIVESVSFTMVIAIDCTGGGGGGGCGCGGSTGGGSTGGGSTGGGSTGGGGYWWGYGSGWPWYSGGGGYYDPNWYWWWTGGGGYGGGSGFSSTVTTLSNQLGLSYAQSLWLENNPLRADELLNYLLSTINQEANTISLEHLDRMMSDLNYLMFVQQHSISGTYGQVWWEDNTWLSNANNFTLDITQAYNQYDELSPAEKILIAIFPVQAYIIKQNVQEAFNMSDTKMGLQGGLNDKKDAFRHAYFNAINTRDVPPRLLPPPVSASDIVRQFGIAHESQVPTQLQLEKQMDLHNNVKGINYCWNCFPGISSNNSIADAILTMLNNGELFYLKPVLTPSQDSNYWGTNGINNPQTATHGITPSTLLTPTNQ